MVLVREGPRAGRVYLAYVQALNPYASSDDAPIPCPGGLGFRGKALPPDAVCLPVAAVDTQVTR
jgi:hypothetical protein